MPKSQNKTIKNSNGMKEYNHLKIEKKWQSSWLKSKIYHAEDRSDKPKYYALIEFPYPSGEGLHVGHPRPYIGMDVIARKRRLGGYNVLYPIGWDAFGLPTENYAIKTGKDPRVVTKENTDNFRNQIQSLGISFDWTREVNTTDPEYYKWTQWIFLQFLDKGLAYKAKMNINWCPKDKIGLANEEVVGGACERCGTLVEKREKEQWMLAITKYADRLHQDLDTVDYLPQIKSGQRNWIGRSEGASIKFLISNSQFSVEVFTTRPDTIFGATYLVLAPEHPLLGEINVSNKKEVEDYVKSAKNKPELERTALDKTKTGVELKGVSAINPASGKEIPIWIADYVLASYGTGAIMAVPAHDERDFQFAKKYNLPIKNVIEPLDLGPIEEGKPFVERQAVSVILKHWKEDKYLVLKWKKVPWVTFLTGGIERDQTPEGAAIAEIAEETGYLHPFFVQALPKTHAKFYHPPKGQNRFAHFDNFFFELKDGEQRPVSAEEKAKHEAVWMTPEEVDKFLTAEGQKRDWKILKGEATIYTGPGILANSGKFSGMDSEDVKKEIIKFVGGEEKTSFKLRDWVFSRQRYWGEPIPVVHCDKCGIVPVPEKDLPVELPKLTGKGKNYQPTDTGESPLATIDKWVNTKCPKCKGAAKRETDTMPNWAGSSWYFLAYLLSKKAFKGPVSADNWKSEMENFGYFMPVNWYNGGNEHTTLHLLYSRFWNKFLFDLGFAPTSEPYMKRTAHGMILGEGGVKMSKSLGNVINPNEIVKIYGADTMRVYEMFMGPFDQAVAWSTESIIGSRRFIEKVWRMGDKASASARSSKDVEKLLHKTVKKVSEDIEDMHFNTAVSSMMILATEMEKAEAVSIDDFKIFLKILSPFAPHVAEELWHALGEEGSISFSSWPVADPDILHDEEIKIAVQINGKVRAEISIQAAMTEEEVAKAALANGAVSKFTEGKAVKKTIYVKGRLINILI